MNISIIIPNYNGEHILRKSLISAIQATRTYPDEGEIIVVDDASQDGSVRLISDHFPEIKLIQHNGNKGFVEAVHTGVESSIHGIIILLNSDVWPCRDFIAPLVRWFKWNDTFCVSPLICNEIGKPARISWNLPKIVRGEIRKCTWTLDEALKMAAKGKSLRSLFASGGSMAFRKDMFLELGGFCSVYKPFYYEDCDLGTRGWQRGWKTFFEPRSKVIHAHQGTINRFYAAINIKRIKRRNRFFYLWLHLSPGKLIVSHLPWTLLRFLSRLLTMDIAYVMALFEALYNTGKIIKLRSKFFQDHHKRALETIIRQIQF